MSKESKLPIIAYVTCSSIWNIWRLYFSMAFVYSVTIWKSVSLISFFCRNWSSRVIIGHSISASNNLIISSQCSNSAGFYLTMLYSHDFRYWPSCFYFRIWTLRASLFFIRWVIMWRMYIDCYVLLLKKRSFQLPVSMWVCTLLRYVWLRGSLWISFHVFDLLLVSR